MTGGGVAVRQAPFRAAAEEAFSLNHTAADSYLMFTRHLQGYGSMAGSDDVGAGFAGEFDGAAADAVEAYAALVHSFAGLAHLINASATNHRNANGASTIDTLYEFGDEYPDADEGVRVEKVTPPSAEGGDGDAPDWWSWIADKVGYLYPDADTDLMRQAGSRWHQEADQLATFLQYLWAARDGLAAQVTPEASLGTATCNQLVGHVQTLAETFRALGDACNGFADEVDDHRDRMEHELASFIAWTVGIQVLAHGLAVFTLGGSEVVGQTAQVAKIAAAANKVRTILAELAVAAALRYGPVAKAATSVRSLTVAVQPLVNASVRMARVRALGVAGEKAAGIAKNTRRIASASRPGRYRIPDQLDDAAKVIGEVKNVKYQGLTGQLKDFLSYADARPGWSFVLYVRPSTTISGPLQALVDSGKVVLHRTL